MSRSFRDIRIPRSHQTWKWWVCGLLLLATMLNYMDRLTFNLLGDRMMTALGFDELGYGQIESRFAIGFALGCIVLGFCVDLFGAFWIYPLAVLAWSAAGFFTGYSWDFWSLMACRFLLGFAEAGNWSSALRTTQRLLPPEERTMGNGILQSGAALGAILTPGIVVGLVKWSGSWQAPFLVVGSLGLGWVVLWFLSIRPRTLGPRSPEETVAQTPADAPIMLGSLARPTLPLGLFVRRFVALVIAVITINIAWHFFRAWLPLFLQRQLGYSEEQAAGFFTLYYIAADAGSIAAGFATLFIIRSGTPVFRGRMIVFLGFAVLTALSLLAAVLPGGPLLLGVLLVIGFGSLGVFPNYYAFSQDLTTRHQGKLTGVLGCSCWMAMALLHEVVGTVVKAYDSYRLGIGIAGLMPLVAFVALVVLWGKTPTAEKPEMLEDQSPVERARVPQTAIMADGDIARPQIASPDIIGIIQTRSD
jgi:ACS family hexuronate transporter-like MFS transporter